MTHRTAAETLANDIAVLGNDYGLAFYHCCQELWRVSSSWDRYEALFGSQERVNLLNESGGSFWHAIQGVLLEHVLLGICRLSDTAGTGQRRNLSVWTLVELDPLRYKGRLKQRAETASRRASFARTWRDKRIAHNDLEQSTGVANKLVSATGRKITKAILSIHEVLRWISAKHFGSDMGLLEMGDIDAIELMTYIDDGLRYRALREAEYNSGTPISRYDNSYDWIRTGTNPSERYAFDFDLKLPKPRRR
ncbi:hypothetical protein LB572_15190 [Mesorhizobium sp. BH1-1-5]|uniref:AbiU2 domain-containing protein n=1 Tax=Mesorhizobium sp. BH1-1-5 TaxID=2876661 RepID=UPI001CCF4AFD|nr:hypothetical protein [Mesorhizobium sp. BH1-1-5]